MIVRLADPSEPGELEAVGELTATTYVGDGHVAAHDSYVDHLRDAASRAKDAELLVAVDEDNGRLLGTITYCPGGSPYAEVGVAGEADFRMLAVDSSARGRGVGAALVHACLDRARADGASAMRLSTKTDMHAAHRLYKRLGFHRTPEHDWAPDPEVPLLTFALDLSENPPLYLR